MKISVITINYNNEVGLLLTVKSVINQTYKNLEYIIIDGGSTDNSKQYIHQFEKDIKHWVSEPDNGIYHAMNKGIRVATGDYCLFLNSGDALCNDRTIENAISTGLTKDLVYGNLIFVNCKEKRHWIPPMELTFGLFYNSTIPHPSTFIRRGLFEKFGLFDENLTIVSDWKFFLLAICRENCSYKHIDLPVTEFNEDGICSNPANFRTIENERELVLKHHFPAFIKEYKDYYHIKKELKKVEWFIKLKKKISRKKE